MEMTGRIVFGWKHETQYLNKSVKGVVSYGSEWKTAG